MAMTGSQRQGPTVEDEHGAATGHDNLASASTANVGDMRT